METDELQYLLGDMGKDVSAALERGDAREEIWAVIVEHRGYRPRLEQAVGSLLRQRNETTAFADDLASEVTVMLTYRFRGQEPFQWKPTGDFTHWFGHVLVNACRDAWDRVTSYRFHERQLETEDWDSVVAAKSITMSENQAQLARVMEAIVSLDEPCRSLLYQGYQGIPQSEIARSLNRSPSSISNAKKRCIAILRSFLGIERETEA